MVKPEELIRNDIPYQRDGKIFHFILNEEECEYTIHSGIVRGIVMSHNKSLLNDLIQDDDAG